MCSVFMTFEIITKQEQFIFASCSRIIGPVWIWLCVVFSFTQEIDYFKQQFRGNNNESLRIVMLHVHFLTCLHWLKKKKDTISSGNKVHTENVLGCKRGEGSWRRRQLHNQIYTAVQAMLELTCSIDGKFFRSGTPVCFSWQKITLFGILEYNHLHFELQYVFTCLGHCLVRRFYQKTKADSTCCDGY